MKIESGHIKEKRVVGKMPNGTPVLYVQTHGGLHAMFGNNNGAVENLSAMPHRGMAWWVASKKFPGIVWDRAALME